MKTRKNYLDSIRAEKIECEALFSPKVKKYNKWILAIEFGIVFVVLLFGMFAGMLLFG